MSFNDEPNDDNDRVSDPVNGSVDDSGAGRPGPSRDVHGLDELLGAYALDAVEPDDARRVEDYLTINPRAAAEVQEYREVATMLAYTGMDAPDGLWTRIEHELQASAPAPGSKLSEVIAGAREADERPARPTGRRIAGWTPWLVGAAATIALVVAGALLIGNPAGAPDNPLAEAYAAAQADRDSSSVELRTDGTDAVAFATIGQDGHGYVDGRRLPTLDADRTYQLWGVLTDTGDVVSLGIFGPNPELETFAIDSDVAALVITLENAPGVVSNGNPDGAYSGELG